MLRYFGAKVRVGKARNEIRKERKLLLMRAQLMKKPLGNIQSNSIDFGSFVFTVGSNAAGLVGVGRIRRGWACVCPSTQLVLIPRSLESLKECGYFRQCTF